MFHTNEPDCNLKLQQAGAESMNAICDDREAGVDVETLSQ